MSVCRACKYGYNCGGWVDCEREEARDKLISRVALHPKYQGWDAQLAMAVSQDELQSCRYFKKKLFKKRTGPGSICEEPAFVI